VSISLPLATVKRGISQNKDTWAPNTSLHSPNAAQNKPLAPSLQPGGLFQPLQHPL
jgi:hypothetical protein